jgi:hypothetical protein
MSRQDGDLSQDALRLVENAELSQHRPPVVVDFLSGQTVIGVKRVHTTKRELDSSPRRRETTPSAEVRTANHDFNQNGVVCDMSALHLDFQVRQRLHQLLVKLADSIPAFVVFSPWLIIVLCRIAEGAENTFKVMLVLKSNVLLDNRDTRRPSVSRNRCACHVHLRSRSQHFGEASGQHVPSAFSRA